MINPNFTIDNSSINAVKAKVELYDGSTLVKTCSCRDALQSFTVDRDEENNKFFGFGVCQSVKTVLIDLERELNIMKGNIIVPFLGDGTNFVRPYPTFHVDEVTRDEETNSLTIMAYDAIYDAGAHNIGEVGLVAPYTIRGVAAACATFLGLDGIEIIGLGEYETCFDNSYAEGANLSGEETVRQVLNAISEATQTIYYINYNDKLVFKRLDLSGTPVYTITKDRYFSLKTGSFVPLEAIYHVTELGDNIYVGIADGITQYVRDNPFWSLREDIDVLLDDAFAAVDGLGINQFICEGWEGNYLLEIGDAIALETEDGGTVSTYVLNDTITFDGTLAETTQWTYEPNENETAANPTSLGEKINQTYARVDKAARQVEIVVSEVEGYNSAISSLQISTESISNSVKSTEETTKEALKELNDELATLSAEVSTKMTKDDFTIEINKTLSNGVEKVQTSTGFTFNDEGLTVSKSDSEISTQITEDGMTITKRGEEVLVADNQGVKAEDLHATTYLMIGNNVRFEDYGGRAACFWIGD